MCAKPIFDRPIAHRGLHDRGRGIIENTASAFAAAIDKGYAIECDVQLSRDGIPMIFHDDELDRLTGVPGPVGARSMAELATYKLLDSAAGDTPQRFSEFLAQVAGRTMLQIELKQQPDKSSTEVLAQTVMDGLKGYRGPVTIESSIRNCWSKCESAAPPCRSASSLTATMSRTGQPPQRRYPVRPAPPAALSVEPLRLHLLPRQCPRSAR